MDYVNTRMLTPLARHWSSHPGLTVGDAVEVVWLGLKSVTTVTGSEIVPITTEGQYFENYASITSDLTTAVNTNNQGLIGPITVTADWTVAGDITIL